MNASIMISHHNLSFFMNTMESARKAIKAGAFQAFRKEFLEGLKKLGETFEKTEN